MANDVVNKINEYNSEFNKIYSKSVVIVKRTTNKITNKITEESKKYQTTYIVIPTTEQDIKDTITKRELSKEIKELLVSENFIKNDKDINSCVFCGDLKTFTSYNELVYQYPRRKVDIRERKEPEFRLYTRTREQQEKVRGYFNICHSASKSWNSVIEKCGSKFGLILKLIIQIN